MWALFGDRPLAWRTSPNLKGKKNSSPIPRFTSSPIAWHFLSPDAYTPSSAGAPTVSSGGTVTAANWQKMQLQGCVFLPAAGYRIYADNRILDVGEKARYWIYSTSYVRTQKPTNKITVYYYLSLEGSWSGYTINTNAEFAGRSVSSTSDRYGGMPVRLVHDL